MTADNPLRQAVLSVAGPISSHPQPILASNGQPEAEPTAAMLDAGVACALNISVHGEGGWTNYVRTLYGAMRAQAPRFAATAILDNVRPEIRAEVAYALELGGGTIAQSEGRK